MDESRTLIVAHGVRRPSWSYTCGVFHLRKAFTLCVLNNSRQMYVETA